MAKRAIKPRNWSAGWYLVEWLDSLQISQADLARAIDCKPSVMSELVGGKQKYHQDYIEKISAALNLRPYELLMDPDRANAIKAAFDASATLVKAQEKATESEAAHNVTPLRRREA